jgi:hypothetical protein
MHSGTVFAPAWRIIAGANTVLSIPWHSISTAESGQGVILPRIAAVFADAKSAAFFPPTHCRKRTAGISKRGRLPWPR